MLTLPNGKHIYEDMVETAMEDSDLTNSYYLNTQTGEVSFFSEYDDVSDEREKQLEEIESSDHYLPIERIPTHEAYQWMEDFVGSVVAPKDAQVAEKLSIALMGKGAFGRFKAVLHRVDDEWLQGWYQWRDHHLKEAMKEWFASLPVKITEDGIH